MSFATQFYAQHSFPLSVKQSDERGRYLTASSAVPVGTTILEAQPYTWVVLDGQQAKFCSFCVHKKDKLSACSACKFAHYCSPECQKQDWPDHKGECKSMANGQALPSQIRFLLRLLMRRDREIKKNITEGGYKELDQLQEIEKDVEADLKSSVLTVGVGMMINTSGAYSNPIDHETICHYMKLVECNSHGIRDEKLMTIGKAIYPHASLFNHSCIPNCTWSFDGTKIIVRSTVDLKEGDEVCISYVDHTFSRVPRQKFLKENYHFECRCPRCSPPLENSLDGLLVALSCPLCRGPVVLEDEPKADELKCSKCEGKISIDKAKDIQSKSQGLYDHAYSAFFSHNNTTEALVVFEKLLNEYSGVLHDMNHLLHRARMQWLGVCCALPSALNDSTRLASVQRNANLCLDWLDTFIPTYDPMKVLIWFGTLTLFVQCKPSIDAKTEFLEKVKKNAEVCYPPRNAFRIQVIVACDRMKLQLQDKSTQQAARPATTSATTKPSAAPTPSSTKAKSKQKRGNK
eukprot:TRINITY_DN1113_c0_g4_i1.p1 TRINITY_DN1113_c0_g4~~TRINITY_DN1113_c0_g4_i1.p1  ORF type:complete len:517 (-),score=99.66 TRINITY_DN1113_c0_g4_i1:782-2332(-)